MLGHGRFQCAQALHGGLAALVFVVAQGLQLLAPHTGELVHALAMLGMPLGLDVLARLHQAFRPAEQRLGLVQGAAGLGADMLGHLAGMGVQRLREGLLLNQGLLGCGLPLGLQLAGQAVQCLRPGARALRFGLGLAGLCGLQVRLHLGQQAGTALFKVAAKRSQCRVQLRTQGLAAALVAGQGLRPLLGHAARGAAELGRQAIELGLRTLAHTAVQALGLLDHLRHGSADHGREALARRTSTSGQAVLQSAAHRGGQGAVRLGGLVLKVRLPRQQLLVELLAALLSARRQGLQLRHGLRQRARLGL